MDLAKSAPRAEKEKAMRWRVISGLMRDLIKLRRGLRNGRINHPTRLERRLGRLEERYPQAHAYVKIMVEGLSLSWKWDREKLKLAQARDGACLLRANLKETDPAKLDQLGWKLPQQPPPKIYQNQIPNVWETLWLGNK